MKILKVWIAVALWSSAALAYADPPLQVGRLNYLAGSVSFAPAEASNEWGMAQINRPVTTGDRLWADQDGRAEMRIGSTAIRIAALTSMDVLRLDEVGTQLRLAQGTLLVRLRRLDAGENFEISTPSGAVLLVQPGSYRLSVDPAGTATTVLVQRGQADVLSGNAPFSLRDNQFTTITAQGQENAAAPAFDEFDAWAAARDRQEERIVATRYVPQEMTGYEDLDQHGSWRAEAQYGNVWVPSTVPVGWAPYRYGRWVWIAPWGWTWVDSAPWGFAPYHYGRWVWLGNQWAWAPGARVARPVYAPALVAFVGGANWSVGVSSGPAVGWVPLGWREPFIPWYRYSPAYVRNVNITHVTNVTVINQYTNVNNVTHIRYVNRDAPAGITVVSRDTFVSARQVHDAPLNVPAQALAAARVSHDSPVSRPERQSLVSTQAGTRLPAAVAAREVMAATAPAAPAHLPQRGTEERQRVRVLPVQQTAVLRRTADAPAPQVNVPVQTERRDRAAERNPVSVQPALQPTPQLNAATAPSAPTGNPRAAVTATPPLTTTPPASAPADAQRQQERQLQQEQQRQARAQAKQLQQQQLQEQKERQHQVLQQRTQDVQQQRERQLQQAQQVEQQRQLQRQQQHDKAQAERAEKQRQANVRPPQTPPPQNVRHPGDGEKPPLQR